MIIPIHNVLSREQVAQVRALLDPSDWQDGTATAGAQARDAKHNRQLDPTHPLALDLGDFILDALARHNTFISAALPQKIYPPLFNRYGPGEHYGLHVDNAVRIVPGTATRIRTDLSATLFLSEPEEYTGGELRIEDKFGAHSVKLAAGDLILYPSTSLHEVTQVLQGERVCAFFWLQSMVRSHEQRDALFDLDQSIQSLSGKCGHGDPDVIRLSATYQSLIQQWVDT